MKTKPVIVSLLYSMVIALWLITGAVIPCLCPTDHRNVDGSDVVVVSTPSEEPAPKCAACCTEQSDEDDAPVSKPATSHSNKFHCVHTSERINPGLAPDHVQPLSPLVLEFALLLPEVDAPYISTTFPTHTFSLDLSSTPELHARTLPLLS